MIKLIAVTIALFSSLAFARTYHCWPYDIVGTSIYKVEFDDTYGFAGHFSRDGRKYPWGRGRCVQQTSDIVRCLPDELKNTFVDISGTPGGYSVYVSYEVHGAATLVCR